MDRGFAATYVAATDVAAAWRDLDAQPGEVYVTYEMYKPADEHRAGHVTVSEARQDFAELVNRVAYGHERVRIVRRGREIAAIVPIEDVEFLGRLEDEYDLQEALAVLADPETANPIPLEQVKAELGL